MNSHERVEAAFVGKETDQVPLHHIGFSCGVASALLEREAFVGGGIQQWREAVALWQGEDAHREFLERSFRDAIDVALLCEHDIVRAGYWRYNRKPTQRLDESTFVYQDGPEEEWRVLRYDPGSEQCYIYDYKPGASLTFADLERQVEELGRELEGYRPSEADYCFEIRGQRLLGHERVVRVGGVGVSIPTTAIWLQATLLRPDLVERRLDVQVGRARRNVQFLAGFGFRYLFGGGDFASNEGPMYSPGIFRELLLPRVRRISEACHRRGVYHLFGSDGDLWPVADALFGESGVDGFYEIDRRANMHLLRLRERFPRLALIGNISSHTVHLGTRDQVIAETRACLEEAKRAGGAIVGVSNYFVPGTPMENVIAVLETIKEQR